MLFWIKDEHKVFSRAIVDNALSFLPFKVPY